MVVRLADLEDENKPKSGLVRLNDLNQAESRQRQQQFAPTRQDVFNNAHSSAPNLKMNPITVTNTVQNRLKPVTPTPAAPTKTLQETVQPLRMQQPDLVKDYTKVTTPEQRRTEWVEQRLEQDRRGAAANPVLNVINRALEPISRGVYTATSYLAPLQQGAGNALGIKADTAPYEPTIGNKALEIGGNIAGALTNPSNISQGLATVPFRMGQQVAQRAAQASPRLGNNIAQRAIEGSVAGAVQGGVIGGVRGETDLDQMATNIGLGAALGGAGDAAIAGIGSGVRALMQRMRNNNVPEEAIQEILALPAPRTQTVEEVINNPTRARVTKQENPYRNKFENLIAEARKQEFRPGFEAEELENLWSRMAGPEDVGLDELIQRAYPSRPSRVTPGLVQQAKSYQNSRLAAGVDLPVRTADERITVNRREVPIPTPIVPAHTRTLTNASKLTPPKESWFERLFGRQGVGVAAGRGQSKELIDTHVTRYTKEQTPIVERIKDAASIAEQDYIDKFAPFRAISNDTYDAAMDSTRANNLANVTIKDKFVDLEGNVRGNSLKDVYALVPRGQKDLADRYLIMRDAISRMERGIRVYGDEPWFPKTSQEAAAKVAQMEAQNPWLRQFGEEWNQFNRNRQDLWVESGIASQELIDKLRTTNPNYTPMQRQMPNRGLKNVMRFNQKEFSGLKAPVKKAVGSKRKIVEPAQSMINSTASSYHAMMRNRAMQKLYEAVAREPDKYRGIIEIVPEDDAAKQTTLKQINQIIEQDGLDGLTDMLNSEIDALFTKSKQASARPTDNHVTVMINGSPVKMNVQEKSLLRAIEGVSPERLEGILRIADTLSRGVKQAATGALAPLQGVKLFARDIPVAFAQSKDKVRFLGDISHALVSQVADWLPEFVPGSQNLGRLAREYYRAGGGYEQYLRGDSRIRATASDITRDPLLSGRNIWKATKKYNPLRPLKELGDAFENIPRIAAFQAAMRRNGWSRDEASIRQALNEAREATVNWSRKGARGQQIESILPYSNAAVQGTYRLAKFMREQPISALGLITAVTGATIAAYEQFKDDPDYKYRSKYAKGIPVYKREDGKFVTIPVEPAYQYIADQVLNFYKWATNGEKLPPVRETIQEGLDAFTPKYIAGPISTFTGDKPINPQRGVATTLGGSSLEPLVATSTGKNYYGGDIVPREYQENSTAQQFNETTSAPGQWAAENLGMDAFTFDYLGQKFGGDLAKVLLPMTSEVGRGDPTGNIADETLARLQLLEDPVMKNKLGDEWYKYTDKVSAARADSNKASTPLPDWYKEVYDKVTSQKKGSIAKAITELNNEKKSIQRDTTLSAKQRADELREVQTEINLLRIKGIEIMEKAGVME